MKYQFPTIRHINDVLPAIEGDSNFIVVKKECYTVINYVVAGTDTFPEVTTVYAAIRRECRGIIFCSVTGKILRRPVQKFFNLGERTETLPDNIDFNEPHIIMDKLDGSMIAPFMLNGKLRWGTKMGLTDTAAPVEEWLKDKLDIVLWSELMVINGYTPIFEWCSPYNQVVLRHPEPSLTLIAIRHMVVGDYLPMKPVIGYGLSRIPSCYVWKGGITDIAAFQEKTRNEIDREGYVIRFDDGKMVKLKCDWYINIHKIKEQVNSERSILSLYFSNGLDDALAVLSAEEKARINAYTLAVSNYLLLESSNVWRLFQDVSAIATRKEFAVGLAKTLKPVYKVLIFKLWDFVEPRPSTALTLMRGMLIDSLSSNQRFDALKNQLFPEVIY